MDAVEYIKQARRMCKWYNSLYGCGDCALYGRCTLKLSAELTDNLIKESVEIVEQWTAEHPLMTRFTGRAMFVGKSTDDNGFTRGKIYQFTDGKFIDDDNRARPCDYATTLTEDDWYSSVFIKVVE